MSRPRKQASLLEAAEWNFKPVPDSQVEACCLYEYGREHVNHYNAELRRKLEQWRKKTRFDYDCLTRINQALRAKTRNFPTVFASYFPHSSWQALRETEPDHFRLMNEHFRPSDDTWENADHNKIHISPEREVFEHQCNVMEKMLADLDSLIAAGEKQNATVLSDVIKTWQQQHGTLEGFRRHHQNLTARTYDENSTEVGFVAINWRYRDSEIKKAFAKWVDEQRATFKKIGVPGPDPKAPSRGQWRDKLKWLGALRFKRHYHRDQLVDYPESRLKVRGPYKHLPDLYTSAAKAEDVLRHWF